MNIEQIKKDWEQHCKEYGVKAEISKMNACWDNIKGYYYTLRVESYFENELVIYFFNNKARKNTCTLHIENLDNYKLFTTFYEKTNGG